MEHADFGILGAGLAGVLLAHALELRGARVVVADERYPNAASPMAPGMINPLAGRKFRVNEDFRRTHAQTLRTFRDLEARLSVKLWHPMALVRLLENADQQPWLEARLSADGHAAWIGRRFPPGAHGELVADPFGSFETLHAGWLDIPTLLAAARNHWSFIPPQELEQAAERIIDCRGWRCSGDPRWQHLPWKCARGEVMTIELEKELPRHLWNGGGWLQPLGDGRWRTGATYAWSGFESPPSLGARADLVARLRRWLRIPYRIVDQQVGVRAVVIDYRPVLGASAHDRHHLIFSGLGSHGAIQGPAYAAILADHLTDKIDLPPDVDVARFAG